MLAGKVQINECRTTEEMQAAYAVMKQLRTHLDEATYLQLVKEARETGEYRLFSLVDDGRIVAVIGFMPMVTLYNGRCLWICDLVTAADVRSRGYGKMLLDFAHRWAEENGYPVVSLSSGLQRLDAHRFYEEKMGYDKVSYVFKKTLR
ncbi:Acetyltransferase (GNAT) family protein [Evansella caseinilytica]|uniref:Acetyltransferase (GNAT) family protein n=1 Tax=Evansella caseinilytica TaxID=1503961 RepID=A0A1H3HD60_9BACI|nr:GNAT family N-acetyltransferase [Evansella caseinilytica]SDY13270.1 Acetyltransferase (GNAT) family protein [Evansella caseinilytica]